MEPDTVLAHPRQKISKYCGLWRQGRNWTRLRSKLDEAGISKNVLKSLRSEGDQLCCPL